MYEFSSKAKTLLYLEGKTQFSRVLPLYCFSVGQWKKNKEDIIKKIQLSFKNNVIIRSSAKDEDGIKMSNAGHYLSVLDINVKERQQIISSIDRICDTYYKDDFFDLNEIIVQDMACNVGFAGVVLTYDQKLSAPYYIIVHGKNTNSTTSVTSGSEEVTTYRIRWETESNNVIYNQIIKSCRELQEILESDYLDIEFAYTKQGEVILFQVRPLVMRGDKLKKEELISSEKIRDFALKTLNKSFENVSGTISALSNMSDWNPAELVGRHPNEFEYSLYKKVFVNSAWHIGRAKIGYKHLSSDVNLVTRIFGYPYVNVKVDFNSYLPQNIDDQLAKKIVNNRIRLLKDNPIYHDKVEFEVMDTCYSVCFDDDSYLKNLNDIELETYKSSLLLLTNNIVNDSNATLQHIIEEYEWMELEKVKGSNKMSDVAFLLQRVEKRYSVFYAAIVRAAFIGRKILYDLKKVGHISKEEYNSFWRGIKTITSDQKEDLYSVKMGLMSRPAFLEKYKFVCSNLFSIQSKNMYLDAAFLEFAIDNATYEVQYENTVIFENVNMINNMLSRHGLNFDIEHLCSFTRKMFYYREKIKYSIARELYEVKEIIKKRFAFLGENIRWLPVEVFLNDYNQDTSVDYSLVIEKNQKKYEIEKQILLPDYIGECFECNEYMLQSQKPTYVTTKSISGDIVKVQEESKLVPKDIEGKIVVISKADPGYDWMFSCNILGLITRYGGIASHMALRAHELDIPAAIGVGEKIYASLNNMDTIVLDCLEEKIINYT